MHSTDTPSRFYAPWCGHCQNLKPKYEKAAKSLKDLAQVAAVDCDDEENKPLCGSMGIKGFPTLKIVKPSKKPGKPIIEDYQGQREAANIIEAVKGAIPNNVKRVTDKTLSEWLETENSTAKAIFFSDKGPTSAMTKVLANEFLGQINVAQIRDKEQEASKMFGVLEYPTIVVLPGGTQEPVVYDGAFTKAAMKDFLSQHASPSAAQKIKEKVKEKAQKVMGTDDKAEPVKAAEEDASSFSSVSSSQQASEASSAAASATEETLSDDSQPTESPEPAVTPEAKPIAVPTPSESIPSLEGREDLQAKCLGEKTSTCVLALLPAAAEGSEGALAGSSATALASLAEIAEKHRERKGNLFPFFSVPTSNAWSGILRESLKLGSDQEIELVAVNGRRGWFRRYEGGQFDSLSVETWIDNIRFGEGSKGKLPESLLISEQTTSEKADGETTASEEPDSTSEEPSAPSEEPSAAPTHGEL